MRSWNTVAVVALVAALLACASLRADENDSPSKNDQQQTKSIKLQGKGRQASEKFNLDAGLGIFDVDYDGDSNLIIKLLDRNGNQIDTLFNQIGTFKGNRGFTIPADGEYLLDVASNGNWSISISQPRPVEGNAAPSTMYGHGFGATEFVQLEEGLTVFKINYTGSGRFTVNLVDRDGHKIEQLINTLGPFEGSKPVKIEKPGLYFLNIGAEGDWTISVQ